MRHGGYAEEDARLRGRAERLAEELRQSERRNRQDVGENPRSGEFEFIGD